MLLNISRNIECYKEMVNVQRNGECARKMVNCSCNIHLLLKLFNGFKLLNLPMLYSKDFESK
jgi:hypothetical protein